MKQGTSIAPWNYTGCLSLWSMEGVRGSTWESLNQRSPAAFLISGGLLLASPVTKGFTLVADVSPPGWLVALFVFPALVTALAGVLGLYPKLVKQTPRLALAGSVIAVVAASGLSLLFGWILASHLVPSLAELTGTAPPGWVFLSMMVLIPTGFALFGVASLRATIHSRSIGLLLLGFAVPWVVILAVTPVYGSALPGWLAFAVYSPMPITLLAMGYSLRDESAVTDPETTQRSLTIG